MPLVFPSTFARFIASPVQDQIRLAWEEIMGYVGSITCCTAYINDMLVFAIFLTV